MSSPWTDLDRPPMSEARLARAVIGGRWSRVRVLGSTDSTNTEVADALRAGRGDGVVVLAEQQTAGRGRLGRTWIAPPRSSILLSAGWRPTAPPATWSLLPLVAGLAVAEALQSAAQLTTELKWPNDILANGSKLAGILAERIDLGETSAIVIGIGVNVSIRTAELPTPDSTSVAIQGGVADREPIAAEILRALERWVARWTECGGDAGSIVPSYRQICATIDSDVALDLPDGRRITGRAVDIDETGRLIVDDKDGGRRAWSAGDVTHLRAHTENTGDTDGF